MEEEKNVCKIVALRITFFLRLQYPATSINIKYLNESILDVQYLGIIKILILKLDEIWVD